MSKRTKTFLAAATILVAGVITAAPAKVGVVISPAPHVSEAATDEALVQVCARIVANHARQVALQAWMADLSPDDDDFQFVSRRFQELGDETRRLAGQVAAMPAHSMDGVQARAAVIKALMPAGYELGEGLLSDLIGRVEE